jgi:hypothetical protein
VRFPIVSETVTINAITVPTHMRHILNIEYEYLRVYINSLALQAVVERCTNNASNNSYIQTTNPTSTGGTISPNTRSYGSVPFSTLITLYGGDQEYVKEVVDASRSLLQTVVEGLLPGDYLKHAPVRTYFRIISGAMFLLKVCYPVSAFLPWRFPVPHSAVYGH